jgi:hypothetical protein
MDFATFSTLGNLFKLFIRNNHHTMGYLTYSDLLAVGQYTLTYRLIKNYTQLFMKNDLIYQNLNTGIKIENLIYFDHNNKLKRNFNIIKENTKKTSVEQLFILYRYFDSLYSNDIKFPFSVTIEKFEDLLKDDLFADLNNLIESSFQNFQKVSQAANQNLDKKDFQKFIFNMMDLNNSTFIEIYEMLITHKVCKLFTSLQEDGKILNKSNDTSLITNVTSNFSDFNILTLDRSDQNYLPYVKLF